MRTLRKFDEVVVAFRVLVVATRRVVVRALENHVDDLAWELELEHLDVVLRITDGRVKRVVVAPGDSRRRDLLESRRGRQVRLALRLGSDGRVRFGLNGVDTLELRLVFVARFFEQDLLSARVRR